MSRKKDAPALPDGVLAQTNREIVKKPETTCATLTFIVEVVVHNACASNEIAIEQFDDALYEQIGRQGFDEFSSDDVFVESYTITLTGRK